MSHHRNYRKTSGLVLLIAVWIGAAPGCGGSAPPPVFDPRDLLAELDAPGSELDPKSLTEIDLGEYFITRRASEGEQIFIRFHLYGIIPIKERTKFEETLQERGQRMRDSIIALIQKSELDHLGDPSWGLIRSELIPTISNSLRTTSLRDVVFSGFSMDGN